MQMRSELQSHNVEFSSVILQASYIVSTNVSLVFEVILSASPDQQLPSLANFTDYLYSVARFGGYQVRDGESGLIGFTQTCTLLLLQGHI